MGKTCKGQNIQGRGNVMGRWGSCPTNCGNGRQTIHFAVPIFRNCIL